MKLWIGLVLLLLGGCASAETEKIARDYSRECRRLAYERSIMGGTPDDQGYYQICMQAQGYGLLSRLKRASDVR